MKKNIPILLSIFSGMILLSLVFAIIAVVLMMSALSNSNYNDPYGGYYYDTGKMQTSLIFNVLSLISQITCIIGTFVVGIVMLLKANKLEKDKGFFKATSILAIVISSSSIIFAILSIAVSPFLSFVTVIGLIVIFAFSLACNVKYKKNYSLKNNDKKEQIDSEVSLTK